MHRSPLSATLGVDYKTPGGKLVAGSSFAFRSGGPVRVNLRQLAYQSVRRDLEVYALWKFDQQYQLRVAVSNLLEQDAFANSRYLGDEATLGRSSVYAGHAMARVTLETRF
jgi:hypothetical protein